MSIAYIVSRFPSVTETFILFEIQELERLGVKIELFSLRRLYPSVIHTEAQRWISKAHFARWWSLGVWLALLRWFIRKPRTMTSLWLDALRTGRSSRKLFLRTLATLILTPAWADKMCHDEIEHIHAHWATHPTLAAYIIHRLTGLPYSFTGHAHDIYVRNDMLPTKLAHAKFMVTISEYNRALLETRYGQRAVQHVHVVHCGVDIGKFRPNPQHKTEGELQIICIGRLEEKKGHRYLIDACAALKQHKVPFKCYFIGEGVLLEQLEAQVAELQLTSECRFLGAQSNNQVQEWLARADIAAMPSIQLATGKQEGIPVALMEAMAMELPVVATNISGISELVKDRETGLLVAPKSANALSQAIIILYNDPDLRLKMGSAARQQVDAHFNLHNNCKKLRLLFNGA